ncbi:hypothetical protein AgCh_038586 [Apium graveolens]
MDDKEYGRVDDVMLPGFRFHPTDEELVTFYLKNKIEQRPLPIELIKQVDIYKYNPWDLPSLTSAGEKEWYFYCPRDRKYRNSARPNRVTGAGFWKATGTDKPIYSSDSNRCIGLKKSLVFYRGRAGKAMKTDWMMHEFRLPSITDAGPPKQFLHKSFSSNDSWAVCRIFKKVCPMAQRALYSWASPFFETSDIFNESSLSSPSSAEDMSCTTETGLCTDMRQNYPPSVSALSKAVIRVRPLNIPSHRPLISSKQFTSESLDKKLNHNYMLFPTEHMHESRVNPTIVVSSTNSNLSCAITGDSSKDTYRIDFGAPQQQFNYFSTSSADDIQGSMGTWETDAGLRKNCDEGHGSTPWGNIRSIEFPFSLS